MLNKKTFISITVEGADTMGSKIHESIDRIVAQLLGKMKDVPWWDEAVTEAR